MQFFFCWYNGIILISFWYQRPASKLHLCSNAKASAIQASELVKSETLCQVFGNNTWFLWFTAEIIEFISNETYCASTLCSPSISMNCQIINELDYRLWNFVVCICSAALFRWLHTCMLGDKTVLYIRQILLKEGDSTCPNTTHTRTI